MNLLPSLSKWLRPAPRPDAAVRAGLHRIGELVGPLLAVERGFERKLVLPVEHALAYCNELVGTLPGLIDVDRAAFASNPLVHALFATAHDIETMLGQSLPLREFLDGPDAIGSDYLYALLASRRHEKRVLGVARSGDTVRGDVPQRLLYFSDHSLAVFAADPDIAAARLRAAAFDSLLKTFVSHLKRIRAEQQDLHEEREFEKTRILAGRGRMATVELELHTRQLTALDARLRNNARSLLPGSMVEALAEFLLKPDDALRLEPVAIEIDRSGILAGEDTLPAGQVATIEFAELVSRDRRKHTVVPVRIRRQDALVAIEQVRLDRSRLILI